MSQFENSMPIVVSNPVQIGNGSLLYTGSAAPEGVQTAVTGSFYFRTTGSLYFKQSGSGNTGWVAVITDLSSYSTTAQMNTAIARAVKVVKVTIADPAGTYESTEEVPANCRFLRYDKTISEVFNNVPTLTIGYTGALNAIAGTADTDLTSATTQIGHINKAGDSVPRKIICTVAGTPNQGAGIIYVYFIETIGT